MKRKIVGVAIVAAIALVGGWNYNQSKNETKLSELGLANVEALAQSENDWGMCTYYGCMFDWYYDCSVYNGYGGLIMTCRTARG